MGEEESGDNKATQSVDIAKSVGKHQEIAIC
jgi:hypothetical protein